MNIANIQNSILQGSVTIPPSKSVAHRALVCSFLSGGSNVSPIIDSKDMLAMQNVINALQNNLEYADCIESGNTLRFMIPVAAALGKTVTFIGSGRLPQRPIGAYLSLLPEHGVTCQCDGTLPLKISGKLTSGTFEIAGDISSQYITGLLLALPLLDGDSKIILTTPLQSKPYVDITIKVLSDFGINIVQTDYGYFVKGSQEYKKTDYIVESDWSQAAFFLVAGAVGGNVCLKGLDVNSPQGDKQIVSVLKAFGANITENADGTITSKKSQLKGINVDVSDITDAVPAIAVAGAFAKGTTVIKNGSRLRLKESDRIVSVVDNLKRMGVDVEEKPDGMIINGCGNIHGATLDSYNDHRIVMAFSVAATYAQGESKILDALSVKKTYPSFFKDFNSLGGNADVICDL